MQVITAIILFGYIIFYISTTVMVDVQRGLQYVMHGITLYRVSFIQKMHNYGG